MSAYHLLPLLGYLVGSVSTAIVVARLFGLQDPRSVGSGNPGATNILRYGGKRLAAVTLLGDVVKGVLPVLAARLLTDDDAIIAATAAGAFLGHLYPVYFGFKGGKGVATAFGVMLALSPWIGLALAATWLAVAVVTRYSSLSALIASLSAPLYAWIFLPGAAYLAVTFLLTVLLVWRHRGNIQRLLAGEESKIGHKTSPTKS